MLQSSVRMIAGREGYEVFNPVWVDVLNVVIKKSGLGRRGMGLDRSVRLRELFPNYSYSKNMGGLIDVIDDLHSRYDIHPDIDTGLIALRLDTLGDLEYYIKEHVEDVKAL